MSKDTEELSALQEFSQEALPCPESHSCFMATQHGGQGHRAQQAAAKSASQTSCASQPVMAGCEALSTEVAHS